MYVTPYRGLGVSLEEMQRRRVLSEWGGGWRSEESAWDNGGEELTASSKLGSDATI